MATGYLILAFPGKNISKIKIKFPGGESVPWLYFGNDFFKRRRTAEQLGRHFKSINIAEIHNKVARDITFEHVQWIDALNRRYGDNLQWWFGAVSSRNIYCSNLFQACCYLEILQELWKDQNRRPKLVVVESLSLARAILKWTVEKDITVDTVCSIKPKLKSFLQPVLAFLKWIKFLVILCLQWLAAHFTRKSYEHKNTDLSCSMLFGTTIHNESLSGDSIFTDRYFPYLHEHLLGKQIKKVILPFFCGFCYNYFSIYKRMRLSSANFIIKEDFLRFSDYLSALVYPLKVLRKKIESTPFRGFDLSDIVKHEQTSISAILGLEPMLIYRLILRIKQAGFQPTSILIWYENRPADRALVAGARQVFPKTKITGVQMFLHPPNFLSLYPSESEVEAGLTPDLLLQTSQYQCNVARYFTKSITCQPAAALRYAHVFNSEDTPDLNAERVTKSILIILPFNIAKAVELLEVIKSVLDQIPNDISILVKTHPDYDTDALVRAFNLHNWPDRFHNCSGSLSEVLNQSSVVISSTSSSMVEAVIKGIPAIFLGGQTLLDQNILFNQAVDIVTECFSAREVVVAIKKYLDSSPCKLSQYKEMGKTLRNIYFTPTNEETMFPFLGVK